MGAATNARARAAVTTEAGSCGRGTVRTTVMNRHHLDVHVVPAPVGVLVFDARVRKMDLLIEVRQVMLAGPLFDFVLVAVGVAVVIVSLTIALVQPALIFTLELVVQNDSIDSRAALLQALRFAFEGAIDLNVMFELALAFEAPVEGLAAISVAVPVTFEKAPTVPRE